MEPAILLLLRCHRTSEATTNHLAHLTVKQSPHSNSPDYFGIFLLNSHTPPKGLPFCNRRLKRAALPRPVTSTLRGYTSTRTRTSTPLSPRKRHSTAPLTHVGFEKTPWRAISAAGREATRLHIACTFYSCSLASVGASSSCPHAFLLMHERKRMLPPPCCPTSARVASQETLPQPPLSWTVVH